jgi:hypothetical protein
MPTVTSGASAHPIDPSSVGDGATTGRNGPGATDDWGRKTEHGVLASSVIAVPPFTRNRTNLALRATRRAPGRRRIVRPFIIGLPAPDHERFVIAGGTRQEASGVGANAR